MNGATVLPSQYLDSNSYKKLGAKKQVVNFKRRHSKRNNPLSESHFNNYQSALESGKKGLK